MVRLFRKKPVVVQAIQFLGYNKDKVTEFLGSDTDYATGSKIEIATLEGVMTANIGDWVIRGLKGEHYPCKPDIFEKTYEEIKDEAPIV